MAPRILQQLQDLEAVAFCSLSMASNSMFTMCSQDLARFSSTFRSNILFLSALQILTAESYPGSSSSTTASISSSATPASTGAAQVLGSNLGAVGAAVAALALL